MKYFNIPRKEGCFISDSENYKNKNLTNEIIIGKKKDNYRGLISFDLKDLYKNINFERVELVLYLKFLEVNENIESYMLNIAINLENFTLDKVNWDNGPKFYEECRIYKIDRNFNKNYIRFDITDLMKTIVSHEKKEVGFTLIGFCDDAIIGIENNYKRKIGFLRFAYKDCKFKKKKTIIKGEILENNESKEKNIEEEFYLAAYLKVVIKAEEIVIESKNSLNIIVDENQDQFILRERGSYLINYSIENKSNNLIEFALLLMNFDNKFVIFKGFFRESDLKGNLIFENKEPKGAVKIIIASVDNEKINDVRLKVYLKKL